MAKKELQDAEAKAEAVNSTLKEAERAEKEQELAELKQKNAEALAVIEKEEEEAKASETPLPVRRITKFDYILDEAMAEPFLYFDMQILGPVIGKMTRNDLVQILHCSGETHCQREVFELLKTTSLELPGITKAQAIQHFHYKKACCTQTEVEVEEKKVEVKQEEKVDMEKDKETVAATDDTAKAEEAEGMKTD